MKKYIYYIIGLVGIFVIWNFNFFGVVLGSREKICYIGNMISFLWLAYLSFVQKDHDKTLEKMKFLNQKDLESYKLYSSKRMDYIIALNIQLTDAYNKCWIDLETDITTTMDWFHIDEELMWQLLGKFYFDINQMRSLVLFYKTSKKKFNAANKNIKDASFLKQAEGLFNISFSKELLNDKNINAMEAMQKLYVLIESTKIFIDECSCKKLYELYLQLQKFVSMNQQFIMNRDHQHLNTVSCSPEILEKYRTKKKEITDVLQQLYAESTTTLKKEIMDFDEDGTKRNAC